MGTTEPSWETIDEWWSRYVEAQSAELDDLRTVYETLTRRWNALPCPFDADPLAIDWTHRVHQAGPLRTNQEENWSRWLAQLLRDSTGPFIETVFESGYTIDQRTVRCERAVTDEDLHDRRVDIVAEFGDRAVTIEVKIGDEHYEKTGQAAYLAETNHERIHDWQHYLLLPERKRETLESTFDDRFEDTTPNSVITAAGPTERDVTVIYWSDIARALRRVLLADREASEHWIASAYLFTTLIEQRIMRFYPRATLDRLQTESAGITDVQRLQTVEPEDQLRYLEDIVAVTSNG